LHSPHTTNSIGIDSSYGGVQDDTAEHLYACNVLARKPGPVGCRNDMALENDGSHALFAIQLNRFLIIE
jgi:hypothetical protein